MDSAIIYLFIFSCFLTSLYLARHTFYSHTEILISLGLFFTVCADYFLFFTRGYLPGILLFCMVQLCYRRYAGLAPVRARTASKKISFLPAGFSPISILFAAVILTDILFPETDAILIGASSLLYLVLLLENIVLSCRRKDFLLLHALTLMLLCDLHLGIYHMPSYLPLPSFLHLDVTWKLVWFYYLPSQLLLACCADTKRRGLIPAVR